MAAEGVIHSHPMQLEESISISLIVTNARATVERATRLAEATEQDERLKEFAEVLRDLAQTVENLARSLEDLDRPGGASYGSYDSL